MTCNMKDSTTIETLNSPDSSPSSSDSESPSSEADNLISSNEPDVSLDEMLSLACRQGKLDIVQLLIQSGAHINHRNRAGNTPLLEACSQGHVTVANYLLDNGATIDAPTETTLDSALTWACTLGNANIVEALLSKKADVEHRTKDGCTALMFACLAGHRDVAEKLLDAFSDINVESDSNKDSPLTFACWKGHYDVVELLLKRTANIEHRTKEGFSPLMFAALGGHTKVARKLLQCNSQVNVPSGSNNDIPLTSACWKGHHDVVQQLLEFNSNIEHRTKDGCTPLMLAAREGHYNVAELLLKNSSQVNVPSGSENNIPLTLACWKGHCDVVGLLLDYGSDIEHRNKAGCTPLMLASREGHYRTTALLLERHAQVNVPSGSNDDTPLTLACWKGHKNVVILLLEYKSNIDHQTKTGCTPLMEATREGHKCVAEVLLNHNADVELPDNYGQSPLFMACWKGHRDVAELLLQRSAYRDCRTKTGITPLFQACRENHVSIVELLLEYGAGVNTPFPNSRENPLTLCAEKGHTELVKLLLVKGAAHDCRTKKGCTPTYLACKEGHIEIIQILAQHGTDLETPDCRGITPIMAAYKNGHVPVVDWLIRYVRHLPSDELCHKILMSSVDDKDKEHTLQRRSKCLAILQETKKKRELLALRNAQNLVQECVDERNREEKKKKKRAEKRRDKQNKRKKNREVENSEEPNHINALIITEKCEVVDDDNDDEDTKDNILPTENREHSDVEENMAQERSKMSDTSMPSSKNGDGNKRVEVNNLQGGMRKNRKKFEVNGNPASQQTLDDISNATSCLDLKMNKKNSAPVKSVDKKISVGEIEEIIHSDRTIFTCSSYTSPTLSTASNVHALVNCLTESSLSKNKKQNLNISRELPRTAGICTQGSSTSGPSRLAVSSQTEGLTKKYEAPLGCDSHPNAARHVVSSIAATTSTSVTTTQCDPRTHIKYITPTESNDDWEEEIRSDSNSIGSNSVGSHSFGSNSNGSNSAGSNSSVSRNSSFDEYRESDWKELTRSGKLVLFELTVPNAFCGRVIGKGGKKINSITEESGAQITIDKPPLNVVPADRVITIKGSQISAEKARNLVTKALNTPSLNYQVNSVRAEPVSTKVDSALSNAPPSTTAAQIVPRESLKNVSSEQEQVKKTSRSANSRPSISADIPVTPLLSYSKVATGALSLNEIQKQLQLKTESPSTQNETSEQKAHHKCCGQPDSDTDSSSGKGSLKSSPSNQNHVSSLPPKSDGFASKDFSYFTTADNCRKTSEHKANVETTANIVEANKNLPRDSLPWNLADRFSTTDGITDRNRSTSWTGQPNTIFANGSGPGNRSMSTEAINDRQNVVISPWNLRCKHGQSADELSDEQLFLEEIHWSTKTKGETTAPVRNTDGWEMSSSRTSSVSSSKVELTNILDNDSGMGGSNPLGPTPTSIQSESRISFQDSPYIDTALENSPWLQNRGAYSAPSSPALQRGNEDHSRNCSPNPQNIRPHPSMEELNSNRPWMKKSTYKDSQLWRSRNASPPFPHMKQDGSPDNQDSGLSSPQNQHEKRQKSSEIDQLAVAGVTPTPWSAERFQDVHTLSDLLAQLSLAKYTAKLEENSLSLESLLSMNEKDLQTFDIPKGPRLKILKACEVIESQRRIRQPAFPNSIDPSTPTFFPPPPPSTAHQHELDPLQQTFNSKHPQVLSSNFNYQGFMSYPVQQQPFNVILPNSQQFMHPPVHQSHGVQQAVFTACDEFPVSHAPLEHLQPNQPIIPHHQFMYSDSQAFYFYQAQS